MRYQIAYSPDAELHLRVLTARGQKAVLDAVDRQLAQNVNEEPIVVSVNGKPVAALIAIPNVDWETARLSTHPQFLALIRRSRRRQEKEGGIASREMRRRLALRQLGKGRTRRTRERRKNRVRG